MLALVVLIAALVAVVGIGLLVQDVRARRTPPELRGDWWTSFERDFRAYAREAAQSQRTRSRRRDQPGPAR
jgi:hypothetical protein